MNINIDKIIKVMNLPKIGRKTAFKLFDKLTYSITSDEDLIDFIEENSSIIKLPEYSKINYADAFLKAERTLDESQKEEITIVSYYDKFYPKLLKKISDPPLILNMKGDYKKINEMDAVAVIGTRDPSDYGFKVGIRLGEIFGENGLNVVSGLAIGCDTAGHKGCLNKNGFTTAVFAHGLDTVYPKENRGLAKDILESGGVLLSEYPIKQRAQPSYFVERDRIQAGLSKAVVVVETDIKGGTMHTVKFAASNHRIVAALNHDPKHLEHPKTKGNQYLINNKTAIPISDPITIDNLIRKINELGKQDFNDKSNEYTSGNNNKIPELSDKTETLKYVSADLSAKDTLPKQSDKKEETAIIVKTQKKVTKPSKTKKIKSEDKIGTSLRKTKSSKKDTANQLDFFTKKDD